MHAPLLDAEIYDQTRETARRFVSANRSKIAAQV